MDLGALPDRIKELWFDAVEKLRRLPDFAREKIDWLRGDRRRMIGAGIVLAAVVLLLAVVVTLAGRHSPKAEGDLALKGVFPDAVIESGDLFLPAEPDYVPGMIPEREKRKSWTGADAGDFWYDPLENDADLWQGRLGEGVDELLERVP